MCVCLSLPLSPLSLAASLRPLHVAARNGLTVVVQELLGKGASVLAVDENGQYHNTVTHTHPQTLIQAHILTRKHTHTGPVLASMLRKARHQKIPTILVSLQSRIVA